MARNPTSPMMTAVRTVAIVVSHAQADLEAVIVDVIAIAIAMITVKEIEVDRRAESKKLVLPLPVQRSQGWRAGSLEKRTS